MKPPTDRKELFASIDTSQPFKRYVLFCYDTYYPQGGMADCCGSYDTLEEAHEWGKAFAYDGYDILDLEGRVQAY